MDRRLTDLATGLAVPLTFLLLTRLVVGVATAAVGELPAGAELAGWAFAVSASVAAVLLGLWARRIDSARPLSWGAWRGAFAMGCAGALALAVWAVLFYGSGSYEKGGYARLAFALLFLIGSMVLAILVSARMLAKVTLRDAFSVVGVVAVVLLSFIGTIVLLPMLCRC